jgi:shikimate kinase
MDPSDGVSRMQPGGASKLYLIGFRGAGKTTVAGCLARRLECDWVDADQWIEKSAGETIREIFQRCGEQGFRELEERAGGGAILRPANRRWIAQTGLTVWLQASAQTIRMRLSRDSRSNANRPPLTNLSQDEEIIALLEQRTPLYRDAADLTVLVDDRRSEEIADTILRWWRQRQRSKLGMTREITDSSSIGMDEREET